MRERRPPVSAVPLLPFRHAHKPTLGFDMFKLSSLYERGRRRVLPHALNTPNRPEFHTVYVGLHGKGELVIDFVPRAIGAGTVTVVARGRVQQFVPTSGVDAWMLLFTPEFVELSGDAADPLAMPTVLWPLAEVPVLALGTAAHRELLATTALLEREHARPLDRFQPLVLSSLLRSLLLRIERSVASPAPTSALRQFFTILERDFARTREVAHYARAAGLSPRRLGELMQQELGKSTKQVVDERVVLELKRLLAHSTISVKELAARTNFPEPTNLVKFFRLHTQLTPLEFRRRFSPSDRRD